DARGKLTELGVTEMFDCSAVDTVPDAPVDFTPNADAPSCSLLDGEDLALETSDPCTLAEGMQKIEWAWRLDMYLGFRGACQLDPVVLDLDGNGMQRSCELDGVPFDMAGDGRKVLTAWPKGGDALLALDIDHDGQITSARELVSDRMADALFADGTAALRIFD